MSLTALKGDKACQVRSLFRSLLRQSSQFAAYNFREYAKRRTTDAFREHKTEVDERKVQDLIQRGLKELQMMKVQRQTVVSQFFQLDRLVVEGQKTLRSNRATNRSARGQIDHDAMEGLPVRQWRKASAVVNTAPSRESSNITNMHNAGWKELPMPRGSELYSPVSQALLRAARIGQVNRPQPTPPEDEKEPGEDDDEGDVDTGYVAMKWSQVPKEMEEPEMEFLAKRRKGLSSVYGVLVRPSTTASQMRKVKVKRVDAEGHVNVWDVLVPEGTVMEGETVEGDEVMTEAPAPGTVVEGVGIANAEGVVIAGDQVMPTPPRRRPPPPKRKAKGPGRGRRKRPLGTDGAVRTNGTVQSKETTREGTFSTAVDVKGTDEAEARIKTEEIGLGDYSIIQDGDEGSEEDEDEGDDGEDGDREEGELSPTPDIDAPGSISGPATRPLPASAPDVAEPVPAEETHNGLMNVVPPPISRDPSSSPDLPLAAVQSLPFPDMTVGPASELAYPAPAFSAPPGNAKAVEDVTVEDHEFIRFHAAEIPDEHIPREGLAAPQLLEANGQARLIQNQTDFLGSLERHLDQNS